MERVARLTALMVVAWCLLWGNAFGKSFPAPAGEGNDKTLSPYFFVKSDDPTVDQLPLKATSALVNISGVIADVQVTQVYKNEGKTPLEAIYVFPASTRAAVYGMKMTIGTRVITAKINRREEARRQYEQAKEQGRSASLLEQQRPNVFQMNVANIMPNDEIKVELKYTELLVPTDRVYEFVYPTVVGPRYSNQPAATAPPSEHWVQNPYLHQGESGSYTFDINVTIKGGMAIKELTCPSHKVKATYESPSIAKITLDGADKYSGNRDYLLQYRLDGDRVQSGLLLYQGEGENFFLLMMQPPKRVTKAEIPGREYIFIVDVSGSMYGFPLEISKKLVKDLLTGLRPTDMFNILLFSGGSSVMAEQSLPAIPENIKRGTDLIDRQRGGGGTELLPALGRALKLPKPEHYSRTVVIATDGYVTVEEEVFDLIRHNLGDANMFTFGIGTSVNRHILEGMARVGMGEPFVIAKAEEAPSAAERFRSMIQSPVLTGVKVKFHDFATYDVEPVAIPDVLAERPVLVFGKWRGRPAGKITVTGTAANGPFNESIDVAAAKPLKSNSALRYLWARHRIALLSDYNKLRSDDKRIKEVTDLGLTYNLLTAYTSFVAIDTEVRNGNDKSTTVKQPLPLPQGVSDYAVGNVAASGPMPLMKTAGRAEYAATPAQEQLLKDKVERREEPRKRQVTVGDVLVSGGLSKNAALRVLRKHLHEIERCCGDTHEGKLVIAITINADGTVKTVNVIGNGTKKEETRKCIDRMKNWLFPPTQDGREAQVTVSFVFPS